MSNQAQWTLNSVQAIGDVSSRNSMEEEPRLGTPPTTCAGRSFPAVQDGGLQARPLVVLAPPTTVGRRLSVALLPKFDVLFFSTSSLPSSIIRRIQFMWLCAGPLSHYRPETCATLISTTARAMLSHSRPHASSSHLLLGLLFPFERLHIRTSASAGAKACCTANSAGT